MKKAREDIEEVKEALSGYFKTNYDYDLQEGSLKGK